MAMSPILSIFTRSQRPMFKKDVVAILVVCTANICRSPCAQGILQSLIVAQGLEKKLRVESAGTHVFQTGHKVDARAQKIALARGIDLSSFRARQFRARDFRDYDHILVMDEDNLRVLRELCPDEYCHKLALVMGFAAELTASEVPDPYYGNIAGFEVVFDMLEAAMRGFLQQITAHSE